MPHDPHSIPGLLVGQESSSDNPPRPIVIPEEVLDRHCLITGQTGSGKSSTATQAIRTGHTSTTGATIIIDPKGDGWPGILGRALFCDRAIHGDREPADAFSDVLYFDSEVGLPQVPMFDIRPQLAAGRSRIEAVTGVIDDLLTSLDVVFEGVDDAVRAPDTIRNLVMALFDPVHGDDAFTLSTLYEAVLALKADRTAPQVSSEWLSRLTESMTSGSERLFGAIAEGVQTRVEKLYRDPFLRSMIDAVPDSIDGGFRLSEWLSEDVVIIIDLSAVTTRAQRTIANVLLHRLWRALRHRQATLEPQEEPALVSLWIDEVPQLRIEGILSQLLAMGRGYGLSVVPMVQFPEQLQGGGTDTDRSYQELITNIGSVVSGRIADAPGLATKLATADRSPADVRELLRTCPDDRWVFSPATDRSLPTQTAPTALIEDPPLPPGHPSGDAPLSTAQEASFQSQWSQVRSETFEQYGVAVDGFSESDNALEPATTIRKGLKHTLWMETQPLPDGVTIDNAANELRCVDCGTAFLPRFERLREAINHCRDDGAAAEMELPITTIGLHSGTVERVRASPLSLRSVMFLRLIERAQLRDFKDEEWDVVDESMLAMREAVGLGPDDQSELVEEGFINVYTRFQGLRYRLTPQGQNTLNAVRGGNDAPEQNQGDPNESVEHIKLVETAARVLRSLADREETPIEKVETYWSAPDSEATLDAVAFGPDEDPLVTVEGERPTNDHQTAIPSDYDAMAAVNPVAAIWVTPNRETGHAVVKHLVDPKDGQSRVQLEQEDLLGDSSPLSRYSLSAPGCTRVVTQGTFDAELVISKLDNHSE